jgi:hypothetical protein
MIEAGDGTAAPAMTVPGAVGLVAAVGAGFPGVAGVAVGAGVGVAADVMGGGSVACGVGKPAFCKVMVALPSGWPMKLGITKAWGGAS